MKLLVRAATLTNYFEVARQYELNPLPLLRNAGLSQSLLANPDQLIPIHAAISLLEESARMCQCETFGLRMAELRQLVHFGEVSLLLRHQRTLREALQSTIHYQHLLNPTLAISIEDCGNTVLIREEIVTDTPVVTRQAIELAIGVLFRMCSALLGSHWTPRSVNFTHAKPVDGTLHRRFFGCPVAFDSEFNGIVCSRDDVDYPNPLADPSMEAYARQFVESSNARGEQSVTLDVCKTLYLLLPAERATLDQVAQALGVNVRTLQRRLDENGVGFSTLLNDVRKDLVLRYLNNSRQPLSQIAALVGYSTPSSFTRWFVGQFGKSPTAWRSECKQSTGVMLTSGGREKVRGPGPGSPSHYHL